MIHASEVLYAVNYIDPVSLASNQLGGDAPERIPVCRPVNLELLDLIRWPYVLYGVKYINLVSLYSGK